MAAFVAGPYNTTYNGGAAWITENGIELENRSYADPVRGDNLGDTIQDGVYRGGDCYCNVTGQRYDDANISAAFWPYGAHGVIGQVGRLQTGIAGVMLANSPAAGTTANSIGPASVQFSSSILAPNFDVRLLYATRLRQVPLRMLNLPFVSNGTRWFLST
jgi:hypothetical protein